MRVYIAAALLVMGALAGCSGKDKETDAETDHGQDVSAPVAAPVLLLNLTIGNETFRFTTGTAAGNGTGHTTHTGSASSTSTAANATGNATGNSTAGSKATGNLTVPQGLVPLNVSVQLGATGVLAGRMNWTLDLGSPAGNVTGNATGNSTGNATKAPVSSGTTLPAMVNHTYAVAGLYKLNFTLTVGNGSAQSLQASVVVLDLPGNATSAAGYLLLIEGTLPFFAPAGLAGGTPADVGPPSFCGSLDLALEGGFNGTYIDYFPLTVGPGASRVYIEGGASEAADPVGVIPDFDVIIKLPDGTCAVGGSEGIYEHLAVDSPAEGEYVAAILHWAGTPEDAYTGFIQVAYG